MPATASKQLPNRAIVLRVLNAEPDHYAPEARAILADVAEVDERQLDRTSLMACIGSYDALIVRLAHRIDAPLLDAGSRLLAVASATTGLDHIDLGEARRRNVAVVSLKGETQFLSSIPATAELTWGLLLSITRNIPAAIEDVREGRWNRDAHVGVDLAGRTLGLVGCGRIGQRVVSYARAFGMRVLAFDPLRAQLPDGVERVRDLLELAVASDVVSVHVPLDASTQNMIDRSFFAAMRPGSYFVNTSRGAVVDESALVDALDSGRLAGAALDVVRGEQHLLSGRDQLVTIASQGRDLIVTPHIGGASNDSMRATEIFIARKLRDVLRARRSW